MSEELKACQFCGEMPDIRIRNYPIVYPHRVGYAIECNNGSCPVRPEVHCFLILQEAIKAWNIQNHGLNHE